MRARIALVLFLLGGFLALPATRGETASPTDYVRMSDGVLIAVNVQLPGAPPADGWPAIIQIDGYAGGSAPMNPASKTFGNGNYATVHMSLRGTGCSGGKFNLFDRRSSYDGYEVIEWIASRGWSNGKVAIWGHSYSGLTGWLVAATQPPSLEAMSVSGLIDDLYRGIVFMGGVSNLGFPLVWTGAYRPAIDYGFGAGGGLQAGDQTCASNIATRPPGDVMDNPIVNGVLALGEDGQWWASHSTITYLDGINVPIHIVQSYQDEQTGPRGSVLLWERLDQRKPELAKRLLLTNGVHSTNTGPPEIRDDRVAFLDCHVRNVCSADVLDQSKRVKVFFEMHESGGVLRSNGILADQRFPLSSTRWDRYKLWYETLLPPGAPGDAACHDARPYAAGSKRAGLWSFESANAGAEATTANLPDEVRYGYEFATDTAIAGPVAVTLSAASTSPDTELYVELNDVDRDGNMTRLQRGLLKASHRELDPFRTDYNAAGDIVRPYHPHTNTTTKLLTPGQVYTYDIEVFPVAHVFRAGHSLAIRITTPPASDALAFYVPTTPAGVNLVYDGSCNRSSILLPVVPLDDVGLGPELGCGVQVGLERCSKPVN